MPVRGSILVSISISALAVIAPRPVRGENSTVPVEVPAGLETIRKGSASQRFNKAKKLMSHSDEGMRLLGIRALAGLDPRTTSLVLASALEKDPSVQVRMACLILFAKNASTEHLLFLRGLLKKEKVFALRTLVEGLVKELDLRRKRDLRAAALLKARTRRSIRDRMMRFFVSGGASIPLALGLMGGSPGGHLRLGFRYRWFELDVQYTGSRASTDHECADHPGALDTSMHELTAGLSFYSVRRSWFRLRHGFRVGSAILADPPEDESGGQRGSVVFWFSLLDLAFSPGKGFWLELSPANLGYPHLYGVLISLRYER